MNRDLIIVARRIVREMVKIQRSGLGDKAIQYYIGLGVSLGIIWEVANGHPPGTANRRKPIEIMRWAIELPEQKIIVPN
jgi:hypothetical protein